MRNIALDEQRHIGFGVKLLADLYARGRRADRATRSSRRSARCCRGRPPSPQPPGWDDDVHRLLRLHAARTSARRARARWSSAARDRPAGRRRSRASRCRWTCRRASAPPRGAEAAAGRAHRARATARSRATRRRSRSCSTRSAASADAERGPAGTAIAVGLHRRRAVAPGAARTAHARRSAAAPRAPGLTLRMTLDDFADVIAGRADPRSLMLQRRRVRVRGNPRLLLEAAEGARLIRRGPSAGRARGGPARCDPAGAARRTGAASGSGRSPRR